MTRPSFSESDDDGDKLDLWRLVPSHAWRSWHMIRRFISAESAERLLETCRRHTRVASDVDVISDITSHAFTGCGGRLELRILPDFGFGGKLWIAERGPDYWLHASAYAYEEDQDRPWFPREIFARLDADLRAIPIELGPVGIEPPPPDNPFHPHRP